MESMARILRLVVAKSSQISDGEPVEGVRDGG